MAQYRHPRAGTGSGSYGYYYPGGGHGGHGGGYGGRSGAHDRGSYGGHYNGYYGGHYKGHYGGHYSPYYYRYGRYYGGYYPYSGYSYPYYSPYFSASLYWGWPYYYSAWPYYYPSWSYYSAWPFYSSWSSPAWSSSGSEAGPYYAGGYESGGGPSGDVYLSSEYADEAAPAPPRSSTRPRASSGASGELRLEVRPEDASVYVDDEFRGTAREARLLRLPPGRHTVELVRPGYAVERHEVEIVRNERADLLVELAPR